MTSVWVRFGPWCVAGALVMLPVAGAYAQKASDIRSTKHNLSSTSSSAVKATTATEICVFCHTPHGSTLQDQSNTAISAPLWNRRVKTTPYTGYTSSTLDADIVDATYTGQPAGSSKLCLSCHDGTIAIGNVGVMGGKGFNLSGSGGSDTGVQISVSGSTTTTMPDARVGTVSLAATSGFTRLLGTNLSNDHPISVSYTSTLATADGEMRALPTDGGAHNTVKIAGTSLSPSGTNLYTRQVFTDAVARNNIANVKPLLPLEPTAADGAGQVQCATCHDPHLGDSTAGTGKYNKFLRGNRLQLVTPGGGTFDAAKDILCLACHNKAETSWSASAHANFGDAGEFYKSETGTTVATSHNAVGVRDLPTTTSVAQTACLACHDVHAVAGSKRLMREGVLGTNVPTEVTGMTDTSRNGIYRYKTAAGGAIEETCFMCHRAKDDVENVLAMTTTGQTVPDIKSDFDLWKARGAPNTGASSMPIRSNGTAGNETCNTTETHTIGDVGTAGQATPLAGKDFVETAANLGKRAVGVQQDCNNSNFRHVECTDCHNPHRVKKGNHAGGPTGFGGTDIRGTANGNIVSNALTGTFGVAPTWPTDNTGAGSAFGSIPSFPANSERCGSGTNNYCLNGVVQYEYQICFKCHSNYAFDDVDDPIDSTNGGQYNYGGRPEMGKGSATPTALAAFQGANGVNVFPVGSRYTNQAMEFWGPTGHRGEQAATVTHTMAGRYAEPNHRSWHPVVFPTGRTATERGVTATGNFRAPFAANLGAQTMYCTDCHGSDSLSTTTNNPDNYTTTGDTAIGRPWGPHGSKNPYILKGQYNVDNIGLCTKCHFGFSSSSSGFFGSDGRGDLHAYHQSKMGGIRCNNCHIAVPHGWKNKALLADTTVVGNEVGNVSDTAIGGLAKDGTLAAKGYTKGPYYMNAMLKVTNWKRSRSWNSSDCNGGVGGMKGACQNQ